MNLRGFFPKICNMTPSLKLGREEYGVFPSKIFSVVVKSYIKLGF